MTTLPKLARHDWVAARLDALLAASEVEQVTLTGNLAYTLPAGVPPTRTHSVVFTQDATGGHTVTFAGSPLTIAASGSTVVEFTPLASGWRVTYPEATGATATAPDATTTTKGVVQLAGDLGGSASAPTVVQATTSAAGKVELATTAEATTGTDTLRAVTPQGLKAVADTKASTASVYTQTINAQTGTAYTLVAADAGKLLTLNNAAAITLTIPASVFAAGQRVDVVVLGAGMVTAVAGSGMTVNPEAGLTLVSRAQRSAFTILFLSATSAVVTGSLAAA